MERVLAQEVHGGQLEARSALDGMSVGQSGKGPAVLAPGGEFDHPDLLAEVDADAAGFREFDHLFVNDVGKAINPQQIEEVEISGRKVFLGGSSWGQPIPEHFEHFVLGQGGSSLCFWFTHHDIRIDGQYDAGDFEPHEIPGVECVVNGHIHRRLEEVQTGQTAWITPGNISRRKRDDATREHVPSVLEIEISQNNWTRNWVEIPHRPFEEVFHETIVKHDTEDDQSRFVAGLAQLESLKTETGQGLHEFLEQNLDQFDPAIATEIKSLAAEVTGNDN